MTISATTALPLFTDLELKARQMIRDYRAAHEWDQSQQIILNLFGAFPNNAYTAERLRAIGIAVHGLADWEEEKVQAELTRMVRNKLLRSRTNAGRRLYELNY